MLVDDENFFARLVPTAVLVDAAKGANGADDAVGSRRDAFRLLDHVTEGVVRPGGASFKKVHRVGVAIDHETIAKFEVIGEIGGAPPVKEGLLDGFAFRVIADGAMGLVAAADVYRPAGQSPFGGFWGAEFVCLSCFVVFVGGSFVWRRDGVCRKEGVRPDATLGGAGERRVDDALGFRIEIFEVNRFGMLLVLQWFVVRCGAGIIVQHFIFPFVRSLLSQRFANSLASWWIDCRGAGLTGWENFRALRRYGSGTEEPIRLVAFAQGVNLGRARRSKGPEMLEACLDH